MPIQQFQEKFRSYTRATADHADIFWLGDAAENQTLLDYPGRYITVLNGYIPGQFEGTAVYYGFSLQDTIGFASFASPLNFGKVIPIMPNLNVEIPGGFPFLYRTRTIQTLQITNVAQFTFVYLKYASTPIIAIIGNDVAYHVDKHIFSDYFVYRASSAIPTSGGSAVLDCYHGYNDHVQVIVEVTTAANSFSMEIQQWDDFSNSFQEYLDYPSAFPFHKVYDVPQKNSKLTRVNITGGGVGETGSAMVTFLLTRR